MVKKKGAAGPGEKVDKNVKTKKQKKKKTRSCVLTPYSFEWPQLDKIKNSQIIDEIKRTFSSVSMNRSRRRDNDNSSPKKKGKLEKPCINKTEINKYWTQLSIGLNSVMKHMERSQLSVALVCTSAKIETISHHLMVLSGTRNIPLVRVGGLSQTVADLLGLRTVLALGFKKEIPDDSIFRVLIDFLLSSARPFHVPWLGEEDYIDSKPINLQQTTTKKTNKDINSEENKLLKSNIEKKDVLVEDVAVIDTTPDSKLASGCNTPDISSQIKIPDITSARSKILNIVRKNYSEECKTPSDELTQEEFIPLKRGFVEGSHEMGQRPNKRVRTMSKSSSGNASPLYEPDIPGLNTNTGRYFIHKTTSEISNIKVDANGPEPKTSDFISLGGAKNTSKQFPTNPNRRPYGPFVKVLGNQKLRIPLKMKMFGADTDKPSVIQLGVNRPTFKQDFKPRFSPRTRGKTNIILQPPVLKPCPTNPKKIKKPKKKFQKK